MSVKVDTSERMAIVVIGHVDHGKSTVLGRLLVDTDSLPAGKLEQVRQYCQRNARPFEYAFLLDGLHDEQSQGITIDSARCFFRSKRRDYVLIDAPGHVEFLKNMVCGAARAEAALLVIDANEGIRENTTRHGYLLSVLGIDQTAILVNKMDLVGYSREVFMQICQQYSAFLAKVGIRPFNFIPISARHGENIVTRSERMDWYGGPTVLEQLDDFGKEPTAAEKPLRLPVQDIYRFTQSGDDRRIVAGRIETGRLAVGDEIVLWPSGKRSRIATIEGYPRWPDAQAIAGQSIGLTLTEQIYIEPGQVICKPAEPQPNCGHHLLAHIFWMGRRPMILDKRYKLKLATASVPAWLRQISYVMDASDLSTSRAATQVERHQVAECVLETLKPIAFDTIDRIAQTGRFVIVDNYEISGGGIVREAVIGLPDRTQQQVQRRQQRWQTSTLTAPARATRYHQRSAVVIITGPQEKDTDRMARELERQLFEQGRLVYYLGLANNLLGLDSDLDPNDQRDELLRRLGEICHLLADAGLIVITSIKELDEHELRMLRTLASPYECLVIGSGSLGDRSLQADLHLGQMEDLAEATSRITRFLSENRYLLEYYI